MTKNMKESELRDVATCGLCDKPIGHTKHPLFYRLKVETWGVNAGAVSRQMGLTQLLGGHAALASIMGPDEDMATQLGEHDLTVCFDCMLTDPKSLAFVLASCAMTEGEDDGGA